MPPLLAAGGATAAGAGAGAGAAGAGAAGAGAAGAGAGAAGAGAGVGAGAGLGAAGAGAGAAGSSAAGGGGMSSGLMSMLGGQNANPMNIIKGMSGMFGAPQGAQLAPTPIAQPHESQVQLPGAGTQQAVPHLLQGAGGGSQQLVQLMRLLNQMRG